MPIFVEMSSNFQSTILLTNDGLVYQINHKHPNGSKMPPASQLKAYRMRQLNHITKIAVGNGHALALKCKKRLPFEEWSSQMVFEWIKTVNFAQCANVVRFG